MKLLLAVDLSPASDRVVEAARQFAAAMDAEVVVMHCAAPEPEFVGDDAGPEGVRDHVAAKIWQEHTAVQEIAAQLRAADLEATALLLRGPTVETALKEAERLAIDLIVVGSHGRGAVSRLLVGSNSEGILRNSTVPVLVVPTRT